jgi:hypothetical protein
MTEDDMAMRETGRNGVMAAMSVLKVLRGDFEGEC